ncbi:MAG TPA: hypothetical protein ENN33_05220 [Ignavibacteria bacterium]|nr:hypothetical protein [Ignavibacteria bacterium]
MKINLILISILFLTISAFAQPQRPRHGLEQFEPDKMLKHLSEELSLTDEQVEKIEPILLQTETKIKELKNNNYSSNQEMMEAHRSVMEKNAELIEEHLTEGQIETFREMRRQTPTQMKKDRPMRSKRLN